MYFCWENKTLELELEIQISQAQWVNIWHRVRDYDMANNKRPAPFANMD